MSQLEKIILENGLVACLPTRQRNGKAMRTESVDGFTVPVDRLKVGSNLHVYAVALDPLIAASDGFREIRTSQIVKIIIKDSTATIETENSI